MHGLLFIAARYLASKRSKNSRYLLNAAFGIALSLIPIIVTLIVADGMIHGITDRYLELGTGHIQIYEKFGEYASDESLDDAREKIIQNGAVRAVWKEQDGMGLIVSAKDKLGVTIRAIDDSFWKDEGAAPFLEIIAGSVSLENENEVILGASLAEELGTEIGKRIHIMSLYKNDAGAVIPRAHFFTVRGIISSGYHEIDALWCIVNSAAGAKLLSPDFSSTYLIAKIDDPYKNSMRTASAIASTLGSNYLVYTWQNLNRAQYSSYQTTRQLLLFIMALIMLVAAINVSSSTSMLSIERRRDIAVLKAFGATEKQTGGVFIICGALSGALGAAAGTVLGLIIGVNINAIIRGTERLLSFFTQLFSGQSVLLLDPAYYLETIPIIVDWAALALLAVCALATAVIAAYFPAKRAGKETTTELLRKN
jgi:lipoprotein-releasing system permease protein